MAVDGIGNMYVSDSENNIIRKISTDGQVTTIAGDGVIGRKDGLVESSGDYLDGSIRQAKFNEPSGLAIDSKGNLYVSDSGNQLIRYIDFSANTVTTVAGDIEQSEKISQSNKMYARGAYKDGSALEASFNFPRGLAVTEDDGLIIADSLNNTIRYLLNGKVTTLAEGLHYPTDVNIMQDGSLLIVDSYNNVIRQLKEYTPYANRLKDTLLESEIPRKAQIEEVVGDAFIRRAEVAKEFRAYSGMELYHGDHIETGANSSLVFIIPDSGDQVTISQKVRMYISDLKYVLDNKITRFYIWSGYIWADVTSLENSDDIFEVETASAYMGVRGTHFMIGIDPYTGVMRMMVAAGVVGLGTNTSQDEDEDLPLIYPSQMFTYYDNSEDAQNARDTINIIDFESLMETIDQSIIEALLRSKEQIDQENEDYINSLRDNILSSTENSDAVRLGLNSQGNFDRIINNLNNLIDNILNSAIDLGIINEQQIVEFLSTKKNSEYKIEDIRNANATPPSPPAPPPNPGEDPDPGPAEPDRISVISVSELPSIEVEYGEYYPELPTKVTILLSNNREVDVPVQWSEDVDIYLAGIQTIIGTLDLSGLEEDVEATDLTATIQVQVQ